MYVVGAPSRRRAARGGDPAAVAAADGNANPILVAVVVVLAILIIVAMLKRFGFWGCGSGRERFASAKAHEVYNTSKALYSRNPRMTYSEFKGAVDVANPILHKDVREHMRRGTLTPEVVERAMG